MEQQQASNDDKKSTRKTVPSMKTQSGVEAKSGEKVVIEQKKRKFLFSF